MALLILRYIFSSSLIASLGQLSGEPAAVASAALVNDRSGPQSGFGLPSLANLAAALRPGDNQEAVGQRGHHVVVEDRRGDDLKVRGDSPELEPDVGDVLAALVAHSERGQVVLIGSCGAQILCQDPIIVHVGLVADSVLDVSRPLAGKQGAGPDSVRRNLDIPEEVVHAAAGLVVHLGEDEFTEGASVDVGNAIHRMAYLQIQRSGLVLDPHHIIVDLDVDLSLLAGQAVVGSRGLLADDVAANGQAGGGDTIKIRVNDKL